MKYLLRQVTIVLFLIFASYQLVQAQLPDCDKYYRMLNNGTFQTVDPSTNTVTINSINLPSGAGGLAVADNFFSSTPSPTFYTTVGYNYYYYDGSAWVNTGHGSGSVNPGGAGPYIYNLDGIAAKLYRYDGTGASTLFLDLGTFGGPFDVMGDADGNVYVLLTGNPQSLNMYDPSGALVCSYNLVNMPFSSNGGGYGIVNGILYVQTGSGFYEGTISGNTVTFTNATETGSYGDYANCYFPPINVTITTPEDLTCGNTSIVISATTSITNPQYTWSGPGIVSGGNTANPTVDQPGTYTVTITSSGGACAGTATEQVVVNQSSGLNLNITASDSAICAGASSTLNVTAAGGTAPYTYYWDNSLPSGNSNSVSPTTPTTYTCTVTDNSGCSGTVSETININPGPTFTTTTTDPSCGSNDGEITIIPSTGFTITEYSIDNGATTQTGGTFPGLAAGSYSIVIADANGCEATGTESLSNSSGPTISTISPTDASCNTDDGKITVTASGGASPLGYKLNNGQTSSNGIFTGLADGNYTVTVTDANGCANNQSITVGKASGPTATVVNSTDVSCYGGSDGSGEVSASGGAAPYTYDWTPVGGNAETASGLSTGTYSAMVKDNSGCTNQVQITISEPDSMLIDKTMIPSDCGFDNGEITLTVAGGTGNYTYAWNPNVSTTDQATDLAVGNYEVTITDDNGCAKTVNYTVILGNSFYIEAIPDSSTIQQGGSVSLHLFVEPNVTIDNIVWTPSEGLSCLDCKDPVATPENSINYTVIVTDSDGCASTDTVRINVILPCADIFVPNTFSPNEDGLNDLQCVLGECIVSLDFIIFNRWGEIIFQTKDQEECWDGTFRGKLIQSGVYLYKLKATLENGNAVEKTGNITVVR